MDTVKMSFSDLLSCAEGTRLSTSAASYFLQCESSEWGMIELTRNVQDHETIHLCLSSGESDALLNNFSIAVGDIILFIIVVNLLGVVLNS